MRLEMESFSFTSPLCSTTLEISQAAAREIGFKVYPGSLVLIKHFEQLQRSQPPRGARVLEIGAGVCALPSIVLSHGGCLCTATDVPVMLELLRQNCALNCGEGACAVAPLTWGTPLDPLLWGEHPGDCPDFIIGADVVYHEPLIAPLLETLVALTEPRPLRAGYTPPRIILSYVQRFKRAKAFFKLARKWFEIYTTACGDVVDYDTLTWTLPKLRALLDGDAIPVSTTMHASPAAASIANAAPTAAAFNESDHSAAVFATAASPTSGAMDMHCRPATCPESSSSSSSSRMVLTSSSADYSSYCGLLIDAATAVANRRGDVETATPSFNATSAASFLGIELALPLHGYIYTLSRR